MTPCTGRPDGGMRAWIMERPWLFLAILAACCLTRLVALGERPIMHDEALFTYYAHEQYYKTLTYEYLPILHGPAHLLLQSIIWHLFGVTDWTMRLQPALLGIAGLFWVISFRPWLGRTGTWFSAAFYTLSPGIGFFQRFFREDGLFLFTSLWIVASAAHWWRTRRPAWLASLVVACTVLFCNKESSLFVYFSVATFAVLLVLVDVTQWLFEGKDGSLPACEAFRPAPRFPSALLLGLVATVFVMLCVTRIFEGIRYDADVVQAIGHDFVLAEVRSIPLMLGWDDPVTSAGAAGTPSFWRKFYLGLAVGLVSLFAVARFLAERRIGHREVLTRLWTQAWDARWHLAGALALSFVLYLAIFTTLFTRPMGPFEIYRKTWQYWGGQHEWGRIAGPFHLHSVNLLLYEFPSVAILLAAWVGAILRTRWTRASGVALLLTLLPAAAFHVILFGGIEWQPDPDKLPVLLPLVYFKRIIAYGAVLAGVVLVWPRLGRVVVPLGLVLLTIHSINYFGGDAWAAYRISPLYRAGHAVLLAGRHVNGADEMEIQLNMDGGWNLWYVMVLVVFATCLSWRAIEDGRRFQAFLTWWFVTSLGAASYAREAVPQVGIHAALPLILLAGSHVEALARRVTSAASRGVLVALLSLAVAWNARSTIILNFHKGGDAAERMAYCPTGTELREHARMVVEATERASLRHNLIPRRNGSGELDEWMEHYSDPARRRDMRVLVKGDAIWALRWYLRDVPWTEFGDVSTAILEKWDYLFVEPADVESQPMLAELYDLRWGRVRTFWTPDPLSLSVMSDIWLATIPKHNRPEGSPEATRLAASRAEWRTLWRYLVFREPFDGHGRQYPSLSSSYYVFCIRKDRKP